MVRSQIKSPSNSASGEVVVDATEYGGLKPMEIPLKLVSKIRGPLLASTAASAK